jgi:hypothetical protein
MPGIRDHEPVVIEDFNGWWFRGDPESAPLDHFTQADNVQYFSYGFETRSGINLYIPTNLFNATIAPIHRIYSYASPNGQGVLFLTWNGTVGKIYHYLPLPTPQIHGPILTVTGMEDFGFVAISRYAYLTPFKTYEMNPGGKKYQLGIQNEYVYVYKGDGTQARPAGGALPDGTGQIGIAFTTAGKTDTGFHIFGVVFETDTGFLTGIGPTVSSLGPGNWGMVGEILPGDKKIDISNIPIGPSGAGLPTITKRHIVATKWIPEYNGDLFGYQYFFVPGGEIPNNTATTKTVEFFDADLIDDASHLNDNFTRIPAGVNLTTYHSRMVVVGEYGTTETLADLPAGMTDNRSLVRLSFPGEPESISKVDGLIITPLDGNAVTNAQEFRDILYVFKLTRTYAYSDNDDEPATWREEVLDQGIGAPVHGVGTVLDSGGVNIDFLLVADLSGLMQFNGTYARPELSWKIETYWAALDKNEFHHIQLVNDSISKRIWLTMPPGNKHTMLYADYSEGMDAKNIKWARWIFHGKMTCITLTESTKAVFGVSEHAAGGLPDVAGIYIISPGLRHDVYYIRNEDPVNSLVFEIPDPTIRTALLGD